MNNLDAQNRHIMLQKTERETERQKDKQTDRPTDRPRQTNRQTDRQGQTDRPTQPTGRQRDTDRQTDKQTNEYDEVDGGSNSVERDWKSADSSSVCFWCWLLCDVRMMHEIQSNYVRIKKGCVQNHADQRHTCTGCDV